jgi:hypothetical protein
MKLNLLHQNEKSCYPPFQLNQFKSIEFFAYVSLMVGIMSFILAILGFVLAALRTRTLAIIYCVIGILTFILAVIVGSI